MVQDLFDWYGRIHIGRWNNRNLWVKAVKKKSLEWLEHTPRIIGSTSNVMAWQHAGLILGVGEDLSVETSKCYIERLKKLSLEDINPEHLLLAYALHAKLSNIEDFVNRYQNRTIPYRSSVSNIRFVDTIGMVVPYLYWTQRYEQAKKQMDEYDQSLLNKIFPSHAFDIRKKLPLGVFDWSRGCGWYILGLVESVGMEGTEDRILKLANALLPLQRNEGGFGSFLFVDSSRMESSGTVMIGLLMLKAFELTNCEKYLASAQRCEKALMMATRRDGTVDYCQGDTHGIGNYSEVFSFMPFVQGMTLLLHKRLNNYQPKVSDK